MTKVPHTIHFLLLHLGNTSWDNCRQHIQMHFVELRMLYCDKNIIEIYLFGANSSSMT